MISLHSALTAISLSVLLSACGGGGSASPDAEKEDAPASACKPVQTVRIELWGDSTNFGATFGPEGIYRVAQNPEWVIQSEMDMRFGRGAVTVRTFAVPNTTAAQMLAHEDGGTWPPQGADIVLVNHGINDRLSGQTEEQFTASLKKIAAVPGVVLQTPLPVRFGPLLEPGYADIVRKVAADGETPLIDVSAYVIGLPDWSSYLVDGIHPASEGYGLVTRSAVVPKLTAMVSKLRCQ